MGKEKGSKATIAASRLKNKNTAKNARMEAKAAAAKAKHAKNNPNDKGIPSGKEKPVWNREFEQAKIDAINATMPDIFKASKSALAEWHVKYDNMIMRHVEKCRIDDIRIAKARKAEKMKMLQQESEITEDFFGVAATA